MFLSGSVVFLSQPNFLIMRLIFLLFLSASISISCSSVKRTQKYTAKGQYDKAIDLAIKKLQQNRNSKNAGAYIATIEEAFSKAVKEDLRNISRYNKGTNRSSIKNTYYTYIGLDERQNKIRPLLPFHNSKGKETKITLNNYDNEIKASKNTYVNFLYDEGNAFMNRQNRQDYRNAHHVFSELNDIEPNYKNVHQLLDEALFQGTDFVLVKLNNHSGKIIPAGLQSELLDFNTYNLDDLWTEYHAINNPRINYSYEINFDFRTIEISPERVIEKEYIRQKQLKNEDVRRDRAGNIMRDSLGNPIKTIAYKNAEAKIEITTQQKNVLVGGTVIYFDLNQNRQINSYPLATEFVFENIFAKYTGDKEALTDDDLRWVRNRFIPFPSNEQMVLDAGHDIKNSLKNILRRNKFN